MNNLPPELPPIEAYFYSDYTIKIDYEAYSPSGTISMDIMNWGKLLFSVTGSFNSPRISIPLTMEQIQKLPPLAECKIKDGTGVLFTTQIKPTKTGSPDNSQSYSVTIVEGQPVVVQVMGLALVDEKVLIATEQADIATQKAEQTAEDRVVVEAAKDEAVLWGQQSVGGWFDHGPYNAATNTPALTSDASLWQVGEKPGRFTVTVGGVLGFSGKNFTSGTAVANYDELRQVGEDEWYLVPGPFKPSDDITVQNYADAVPYFSGDAKRRIYVTTDHVYYDGDLSFYDYTPGKGEALLGIDFNYKD